MYENTLKCSNCLCFNTFILLATCLKELGTVIYENLDFDPLLGPRCFLVRKIHIILTKLYGRMSFQMVLWIIMIYYDFESFQMLFHVLYISKKPSFLIFPLSVAFSMTIKKFYNIVCRNKFRFFCKKKSK